MLCVGFRRRYFAAGGQDDWKALGVAFRTRRSAWTTFIGSIGRYLALLSALGAVHGRLWNFQQAVQALACTRSHDQDVAWVATFVWRLHGCHGNRCIRIFSGIHGCPWISWWTVRPSLPFLGFILGIRFHGFSMGWIRFLFSPIPRSLGGGHWRCHTCLLGLARQA